MRNNLVRSCHVVRSCSVLHCFHIIATGLHLCFEWQTSEELALVIGTIDAIEELHERFHWGSLGLFLLKIVEWILL